MTTANVATQGLASLADKYDALLCDIWGVVHNGLEAHPSAVEALIAFRKQGGHVVLISNASRPRDVIAKMLADMDISAKIYDEIVTSGDVTRDLLSHYEGQGIYHVGPETDLAMFDGLNVPFAPVDEASAVVVTGLNGNSLTPDDFADDMAQWLKLDLPFICANPDKIVEVGEDIVYCPGALADVYAEMGGRVQMAGKPYAPIYEAALEKLAALTNKTPDKSRVLAVGDSVRTDATGAADANVDLLFITGSIHAGELEAAGGATRANVEELVAPSEAHLAAFMPRLAW